MKNRNKDEKEEPCDIIIESDLESTNNDISNISDSSKDVIEPSSSTQIINRGCIDTGERNECYNLCSNYRNCLLNNTHN